MSCLRNKTTVLLHITRKHSFLCLSRRTLHMVVTSCGGYFRWVVLLCWVTGLVMDFSIIWLFRICRTVHHRSPQEKPLCRYSRNSVSLRCSGGVESWDLWDKQALQCRWHCQGCRYYCKLMSSGLREDSRHASGCASEADVTICLHS